MNPKILSFVNKDCDYIDLENYVCRFLQAGLVPRNYKDSFCPYCSMGLDHLKREREEGGHD